MPSWAGEPGPSAAGWRGRMQGLPGWERRTPGEEGALANGTQLGLHPACGSAPLCLPVWKSLADGKGL